MKIEMEVKDGLFIYNYKMDANKLMNGDCIQLSGEKPCSVNDLVIFSTILESLSKIDSVDQRFKKLREKV